MSHARDRYVNRTRENQRESPFRASLSFGLSPLQFSKSKKKHGVEQVRSEEEMERLLSEQDSKNIKRAISTNLWYNDVHQIWMWSYLDYNVYVDITA